MTQLWPSWDVRAPFDRVTAAHAQGEPAGLRALLELAGVDLDELWPTIYSARVCAMAVLQGHAFVHHERRIWTPLPASLGPDARSADEESVAGPQWQAGVLELPKYFGAFLDAPLAVYDPNHRHKWRAHELLHRHVGFFWNPSMTRLEAYLGARLSELLPVVHWYGLDEVGRARCEKHRGKLLRREFCPDCEALRSPYWTREAPSLEAFERWYGEALIHFVEELDVIEREMATGQPISSPRSGLDASSDARAYMVGHWNRMTAWSFGAWVEAFGESGRDYEAGVPAMFERVRRMGDALLVRPVSVEADVEGATRLRERQRLRDLGYRCLCALEWCEDEQVEAKVWPGIEAIADAAARLGRGEVVADLAARESDLWARFAGQGAHFPGGLVDGLADQGACFGERPDSDLALEQIAEGLRSALPDTMAEAEIEALGDFAESASFHRPGGIAARYAEHLGAATPEAVALESWLRARPLEDSDADDFGVLPDDVFAPEHLRPHATLRHGEFGADAIEAVLGWRPEGDSAHLAAIWKGGEPRVIECDESLRSTLDALTGGEGSWVDEALTGLLEASFAVYLPPV